MTFSPPKKSPKSRLKPRFQDFLFRGRFYEANGCGAPFGTLFVLSCTDGAMRRLPAGTTFLHAEMPATDIVRKNARCRDASQPPQGVRWRNVRSRHRQALETLRRRSRHIERTVQFASFWGTMYQQSPFLFWGSLKPRFLFRREREKAVSGRLPPSPPQRRNTPRREDGETFPFLFRIFIVE